MSFSAQGVENLAAPLDRRAWGMGHHAQGGGF